MASMYCVKYKPNGFSGVFKKSTAEEYKSIIELRRRYDELILNKDIDIHLFRNNFKVSPKDVFYFESELVLTINDAKGNDLIIIRFDNGLPIIDTVDNAKVLAVTWTSHVFDLEFSLLNNAIKKIDNKFNINAIVDFVKYVFTDSLKSKVITINTYPDITDILNTSKSTI